MCGFPGCRTRKTERLWGLQVCVLAENGVGTSQLSLPGYMSTDAAPPDTVTDLRIHASAECHVDVAWSPPHRDNGAPVSHYSIDCALAVRATKASSAKNATKSSLNAPGGIRWWRAAQCAGDVSTARVEELKPGRSYVVRVRAANARGKGPWSDSLSVGTSAAPPCAPDAPTFSQRTAASVRVKWAPPSSGANGCTVTAYLCAPAFCLPLLLLSGG